MDSGRYPYYDYPTNDIGRYPAADRYPISRYPVDVYPERYPSGDRYPSDRYPADRYPIRGGGRYPARPSTYPNRFDDGYPGTGDAGRYPYVRYPVGVNRDPLPLGGDRYPDMYNKYPPTGSSYPGKNVALHSAF